MGQGGCRVLGQTLFPPPRSGQKPKSCCRSQRRRKKRRKKKKKRKKRKKCLAETLLQSPLAAGFSVSRTSLGSLLGSERSYEELSQLLGDVATDL